MKATITKEGHLYISRNGARLKAQICPHHGGITICGDWCPHFGEVVKRAYMHNKRGQKSLGYEIATCGEILRLERVVDERL